MSESMVERMVRVLAEYDPGLTDSEYRHVVRAVLTAMREPTEAMRDAGDMHATYDYGDSEHGFFDGEVSVEPIWEAMIDAALEGK